MKATITKKIYFDSRSFLIYLKADKQLESDFHSGSFAMIKVNDQFDPYLRRPFSIASFDKENNRLGFLIKVVGKATGLLETKPEGEKLDIIAPLGSSFFPDFSDEQSIWLIAGGTGVAPFLRFVEKNYKYKDRIKLFIGAKTASEVLLLDQFHQISFKPLIATEDGSLGSKALVTDLLLDHLEKSKEKPDKVYSCGPYKMMQALDLILSKRKIDLYLSLENMMGCGFGICLGCVEKSRHDNSYLIVCKDGPVFNSNRLRLNQ